MIRVLYIKYNADAYLVSAFLYKKEVTSNGLYW